jgi:hypothetical protein
MTATEIAYPPGVRYPIIDHNGGVSELPPRTAPAR